MTRPILFLIALLAPAAALHADDPALGPDGKPLFGHSVHGEAFDEGPRQAAVLLPGMGNAQFTITTHSEEAQKFFNQGVNQLHGFWYFEAERSFRQTAKLDPECAMAYWGMAMANCNNEKRAAEFIKKALEHRAQGSDRERAWLAVYEPYFADGKNPTTEKRKALGLALQKLVADYPDDLEAQSFFILQLWENQGKGVSTPGAGPIEKLAAKVLEKNPAHPGIHHYLIHYWNYKDDARALPDAAVMGQSAPGVAHMWHMPGHTFSRLNRFADAAWQQEASARTDHAYMAAARILPEQIHNYAHNNDWLVQDLHYVGRVGDAIDLAKNMIELPRLAPKTVLVGKDDTSTGQSGFSMGRKRLQEVLVSWERWEELLALENSPYLEPGDDPTENARRLRDLATAAFQLGDRAQGEEKIAALEQLTKPAPPTAQKPAEAATPPPRRRGGGGGGGNAGNLTRILADAQVYQGLSAGKSPTEMKPLLEAARDIPPLRLSQIYLQIGDTKKAAELAERAVKSAPSQVLPLANLAAIQWQSGSQDAAKTTLEKLRPLCAKVSLGEAVFTRLRPIADAAGWPADWRPALAWPSDSGQRPDLASLGPFRWKPYDAPAWDAVDQNGKHHLLADYRGQPLLIVFYLGNGCSHCIAQLNALGPAARDFEAAGIRIVAVGTDNAEDLQKTFVQAEGAQGFPFPILADPTLAAFKAYRVYDDFESVPLHAAFLVDPAGHVRWQDISYRPFKDFPWLLKEANRLLKIPVAS